MKSTYKYKRIFDDVLREVPSGILGWELKIPIVLMRY